MPMTGHIARSEVESWAQTLLLIADPENWAEAQFLTFFYLFFGEINGSSLI